MGNAGLNCATFLFSWQLNRRLTWGVNSVFLNHMLKKKSQITLQREGLVRQIKSSLRSAICHTFLPNFVKYVSAVFKME